MPDPSEEWLSELRRDLDAAAARSSSAADPLVFSARAAFENWWLKEHEAILLPKETLSPEPPAPRPARPEAATRASLQARVERLSVESQALQDRLEASLSRCRREHEARIVELETRNRRLEAEAERLKLVEAAKAGLQQQQEALRRELALEREKGAAAEKALLAEKERAAEQEARIAKLREELATQAAALQELRRRGDEQWEKLVRAKELTDSDVALLREELRFFLEDLKIVRATLRRNP